MFYFRNRQAAKLFALKSANYKFVDNGSNSPVGKRWSVMLMVQKAA